MNELNLGVKIHGQLIVNILHFADDIVLIAGSEEHLQRMLDFSKSLLLTEQNECKHINKQKLFIFVK